jgi:Fe-S-cluster-containing hydrogenase component 2
MKKVLFVDHTKCSGCRLCEVICSWFHEIEFNPSLARIKILSYRQKSIDVAIICEQCDKAPCQEVCLSGALSYNSEFNAYTIDEKKCIGCKLCITSCPVGAIGFNSKKGISFKCDLCKGEPKCVNFCPMGAIEFIEPEKISSKKKSTIAKKLLEIAQK